VVAAFDRERAYSLNGGDETMSVIDCATNSIKESVHVGDGPQYAQRANGLLYVTDGRSNDLAIVDEASLQLLQRIPVGPAPERCVFDAERSEIWTNNMADGTLSAISLASREVVATMPVGPEPIRLTPWDSRGRNEWGVLCRSSATGPRGAITFIDGASHTVAESLQLPGRALNWNWGIGPRHGVVYVTLTDPPQLAIVDAVQVRLVDTVPLGAEPEPAGLGPGVVVSKSGGVFIACQSAVAYLTLE
jgi:YVTN family beta-propeller protein